jgi:hypothetical protein
MLLLPTAAHAGSQPPRPSKNYPGLSAYVEVIPTATGESATSKPDVAATKPPATSTKPTRSGKESKLLQDITRSPKYGAPQPSSAAPPATTESQASAFGAGWIVAIAVLLLVSVGAVVVRRRHAAGR